jgi:flagellar basal body P-ring formation protein FlgA
MDPKIYRLAVIVWGGFLVVGSGVGAVVPGPAPDALLQVHLPREVAIQDLQLNLGRVSVIRGPGAMVAKAAKIGLGRFSAPGQEVVLDQATILSRLASSGIFAAQVRLTGAQAVTVRRQQEIIETEDFVEAARQFLQQYAAGRSACRIIPMVRPKDLVLPQLPKQVKLTPQLGRRGTRGHVTVRIHVTVNGQEIGTRDVSFRLRYERHRVVAVEQIPEGTVLSAENVKIETTESDQPEPAGWKPPYGQIAARTLAANAEIRSDMVGSAQSAVVVHRNEVVQIRLERPGIVITAMGKALQEARTGEYLKVRNSDSQRVIMCRVKGDGTVEPML